MNAQDESLAGIYANALLELTFDKGVHAEVLAELKEFGGLLAQNEEFGSFLNTPRVAIQAKQEVLKKVFGGVLSDPTLNFLLVVVEKRRQHSLPAMVEAFERGYHERMNELMVRVTSAVALSDEHRNRLKASLKKKYDKEIILEEQVDAALLGGLVLRVGDSRIDGSLRARLSAIGERLEAARFRSEDYYEN